MKTVYLSGPMTGYQDHNFPAFHAAAAALREFGWTVINPAEFDQGERPTWESCLRKDIAELMKCEAIVVLPGWQRSRGARLEAYIAKSLGMEVFDFAEVAA